MSAAISKLLTSTCQSIWIKIWQRLLWRHWSIGIHSVLWGNSVQGLIWLPNLLMRVFYPQSWVLYQILWIWFLHWVRNWSLWTICLSNEVVRRFLFIVRRALFRGSSLIDHLMFESIWGRSFFNNFTVEMIALIWLFRMKCQFLREFWCGSCQTSDWKDRNLFFWSIKRGGPRLSGLILFIMLFQSCSWVH